MPRPKPTPIPIDPASIAATIPDPSPSPLQALIDSGAAQDYAVSRFIALLRSFPPRYAHAICDAVESGDPSPVEAIAKACRVSRASVYQHLAKARRIAARMKERTQKGIK